MLCAVIVRFGLALVCSIARIVPSLRVLPIEVRREVLKILCPHVSEDDGNTLFRCVASLSDFSNTTATDASFHVFSPPCDRCVRCQSHLVRYNNSVEVDYYHLNGSSKGVKCSLKCSRCGIFNMVIMGLTGLRDSHVRVLALVKVLPSRVCLLENTLFSMK